MDKQQYEWMHQPLIYNSKMQELVYGTTKEQVEDRMQDLQKFWDFVEEFQAVGSGWILSYIKQANLNVFDFEVIRGGKYLPLPNTIKNKKACINVENDDEKCFKWAILAALHNEDIDQNHDRGTKYYPYQNELNEEGLVYPVNPMDKKMLKQFDDNNNVLINIWGLTEKNKVVVYRSAHTDHEHDVDEEWKEMVLLLISNEDGESHYVYVKNISRLLKGRKGHKDHRTLYYCLSCLTHKLTQEELDEHKKICYKKGSVTYPEGKTTMEFENFKNMWRLPFVIYADFECIVEKFDDDDDNNGNLNHNNIVIMSMVLIPMILIIMVLKNFIILQVQGRLLEIINLLPYHTVLHQLTLVGAEK